MYWASDTKEMSAGDHSLVPNITPGEIDDGGAEEEPPGVSEGMTCQC